MNSFELSNRFIINQWQLSYIRHRTWIIPWFPIYDASISSHTTMMNKDIVDTLKFTTATYLQYL